MHIAQRIPVRIALSNSLTWLFQLLKQGHSSICDDQTWNTHTACFLRWGFIAIPRNLGRFSSTEHSYRQMCWCSASRQQARMWLQNSQAVVDQRPLTQHPELVFKESQQETDHAQHVHEPRKGLPTLASSSLKRNQNQNSCWVSGTWREWDHTHPDSSWHHCFSPVLHGNQVNSSYSPATAEPIATAVKAAKPLPVRNHVLFLQQTVMNQKSRVPKPVFTSISCCPRQQAFLLAWVFKGNHLKRADTPQWCWNCLLNWNTSTASTTSIIPNKLLIQTLI